MHVNEAATYCGSNEACAGFTWASNDKEKLAEDGGKPLVYFKGPLVLEALKSSINGDQGWSSYLKLNNATAPMRPVITSQMPAGSRNREAAAPAQQPSSIVLTQCLNDSKKRRTHITSSARVLHVLGRLKGHFVP